MKKHKKNKIITIAIIITILIIALALYISFKVKNNQRQISFANTIWTNITSQEKEETIIKMYKKTPEEYYFYLPQTANLNALPIYFSNYSSVKIGNYEIKNGSTYSFENEATYDLYLNETKTGTLKFYKSDSPAMFINSSEELPTQTYTTTASGETLEDKDNLNISGTIVTVENGQDIKQTNLKRLKGRGNITWLESYYYVGKYSYNITLEEKTELFSTVNKGKKYCLLANNGDYAYTRNITSFELAKRLGLDYTPTFQYIELYNNGNYIGSYLLTDKIEINSQSVNLSSNLDDLNEIANNGADLSTYNRSCTNGNLREATEKGYKKWVDINDPTKYEDNTPLNIEEGDGTYLLELDITVRFKEETSGFVSNYGQCVVVKTPEYASKSQVDYISSLFNKAEKVIYNSESTLEDIEEIIDIDSFLKVYLIQELSKNTDACDTSYFIYYDSKIDKRLHAGPVWDFDRAYGQYDNYKTINSNVQVNFATSDQWFASKKGIYSSSEWLDFEAGLLNNKYVWQRFKQMWNKEKGFYDICKEYINGSQANTLNYYINSIKATANMNELRWEIIKNDLIPDTNNNTGKTYEETTKFLKEWLDNRLEWLNSNINEE